MDKKRLKKVAQATSFVNSQL